MVSRTQIICANSVDPSHTLHQYYKCTTDQTNHVHAKFTLQNRPFLVLHEIWLIFLPCLHIHVSNTWTTSVFPSDLSTHVTLWYVSSGNIVFKVNIALIIKEKDHHYLWDKIVISFINCLEKLSPLNLIHVLAY